MADFFDRLLARARGEPTAARPAARADLLDVVLADTTQAPDDAPTSDAVADVTARPPARPAPLPTLPVEPKSAGEGPPRAASHGDGAPQRVAPADRRIDAPPDEPALAGPTAAPRTMGPPPSPSAREAPATKVAQPPVPSGEPSFAGVLPAAPLPVPATRPDGAPQLRPAPTAEPAPAPSPEVGVPAVVRVSIGRIEVRTTPPRGAAPSAPPPAQTRRSPAPTPAPPRMSLDAYLQRRRP